MLAADGCEQPRFQVKASADNRIRQLQAHPNPGNPRGRGSEKEKEVVLLMSAATTVRSGLGRRRWLILAVIAFAQLMVVLDLTGT